MLDINYMASSCVFKSSDPPSQNLNWPLNASWRRNKYQLKWGDDKMYGNSRYLTEAKYGRICVLRIIALCSE